MRTKNYLLVLWVCFSIVLIADVILSEVFVKDFYLKGSILLSDFRLFIFRKLSNVREPLHFFSDESTDPFTLSVIFSNKRNGMLQYCC